MLAGWPRLGVLAGSLLFSLLPAYFLAFGGVATSTPGKLENHGHDQVVSLISWRAGRITIFLCLAGVGIVVLSFFAAVVRSSYKPTVQTSNRMRLAERIGVGMILLIWLSFVGIIVVASVLK